MSTQANAPVTEAHINLARSVYLSIEAGRGDAFQLVANFERDAVAAVVKSANDEFDAVTKDNIDLRAQLAAARNEAVKSSDAWQKHNSELADQLAAEKSVAAFDKSEKERYHKLLMLAYAERDALAAQVAVLREALDDVLVPHRKNSKNGRPSGSYVQTFRFEHAKQVLAITPESASAELAELREDKARLDWLEAVARVECGNCDRETASFYIIAVPTGRDYYKGGKDKSLRAAIDAARRAAP